MDSERERDSTQASDSMTEHSKKPTFCKIFLVDGPKYTKYFAVRIPNDFLDLLDKEVPETATLRRATGGRWQVKVAKDAEGISLVDGWELFIDDNSLSNGDLLVFRYLGNWSFEVQIFRPCGKEKKDLRLGRTGHFGQRAGSSFSVKSEKKELDLVAPSKRRKGN